MDAKLEDGSAGRVRMVRPRWGGVILVCGKCLKKHDDGKALRRTVKEAAQDYTAKAQAAKAGAGVCGGEDHARAAPRKVRIVKTACVGLCPRRAIVLASAATLAKGEVMLVGKVGDVAEAIPVLLRSLVAAT